MGRIRRLKWLSGIAVLGALIALAADGALGRYGPAAGSEETAAPHRLATTVAQLSLQLGARPAAGSDEREDIRSDSYQWIVTRDDKRVKIKGSVPSEDDRKTIHGMIKANMPDLEIDDRTKVADGVPSKQVWLGAVSFVLVQLSQMKVGIARLEDVALYVQGEARTAAAYAAIHDSVVKQLPNGMVLSSLSLIPPVAKPFVWTAQYEQGSLSLTGHIPNEEARAKVLQQATRRFASAQIVDRMELASGAPERLVSVIASSLDQLVRLETGKITISDTSVAIEGTAATKGVAGEIVEAIRQALPKGYESRDSIKVRLQGETAPGLGPRRLLARPQNHTMEIWLLMPARIDA